MRRGIRGSPFLPSLLLLWLSASPQPPPHLVRSLPRYANHHNFPSPKQPHIMKDFSKSDTTLKEHARRPATARMRSGITIASSADCAKSTTPTSTFRPVLICGIIATGYASFSSVRTPTLTPPLVAHSSLATTQDVCRERWQCRTLR
jgi:hypothetical protein